MASIHLSNWSRCVQWTLDKQAKPTIQAIKPPVCGTFYIVESISSMRMACKCKNNTRHRATETERGWEMTRRKASEFNRLPDVWVLFWLLSIQGSNAIYSFVHGEFKSCLSTMRPLPLTWNTLEDVDDDDNSNGWFFGKSLGKRWIFNKNQLGA